MALQVFSPIADILLTDLDIPVHDELYMKEISRDEFMGHFGELGIISGIILGERRRRLRRIFATLPLQIGQDDSRVIPIPFIVDTGAPGDLYLGLGATRCLQQHIHTLQWHYHGRNANNLHYLKGTLLYRHSDGIVNPLVSDLPEKWLKDQNGHVLNIWNDPRANILGLQTLCDLEIDIYPNRILQDGRY